MKVLKANIEQKKQLESTYNNGAVLQFIKDANNNWVVNDAVLCDDDFEAIKEQLQSLPLIDFEPIETSLQ